MHVSEYRWIDNAAALGAAGWLADDNDIATRRSRVVHLDDEALVFEGVQERRDLFGESASQAATLKRTMHRWNAAAPQKATVQASSLWNSFMALHPAFDAASVRSFFTATDPTPYPVGNSTAREYLDSHAGAKAATTIPPKAHDLPLLKSLAFAASNALYGMDCFLLSTAHRGPIAYGTIEGSIAVTETGSGLPASYGHSYYWQQWIGESQPTEQTFRTHLDIDIYKSGGQTNWADQMSLVVCWIEHKLNLTWHDADNNTDGSREAIGCTPLLLAKGSNGHFTFAADMPQSAGQVIRAIVGNRSIEHGYKEIYSEYLGFTFIGITDPIASPASYLS